MTFQAPSLLFDPDAQRKTRCGQAAFINTAMNITDREKLIELNTERPIWERFFTVAPLVVIGTKEGDHYDLAPKHMAMPLGYDNYFGFVCTPRHGTYHNAKREGAFTVSFPHADQVVLTSLAASPRGGEANQEKPILEALPTFRAEEVDALFVAKSYLYLECRLFKIVDGFGENSLICGRIVRAFVEEDALRQPEREDQELIRGRPLLAYLAYGRFAEIKESYAFPFPKDFSV